VSSDHSGAAGLPGNLLRDLDHLVVGFTRTLAKMKKVSPVSVKNTV
jgi:hypothetical protein